MNFLAESSRAGARLWTASVARSLLPPEELKRSAWTGTEGHVMTWWGPLIPVRPADTIVHFATPMGAMIEAVIPQDTAASLQPPV